MIKQDYSFWCPLNRSAKNPQAENQITNYKLGSNRKFNDIVSGVI